MSNNWRDLGDTTLEEFTEEFARFDSPLLAEAPAIYAAVKGHSKLALAMLHKEQKYGTWNQIVPRDYKNPFSQTRPGASSADGVNRWQRFSTYEQAAAYWKQRLTSPTGPYAGTDTLEELVHIYAPDYDQNNEAQYVAQLREKMSEYADATGGTPMALNMAKNLIPHPHVGVNHVDQIANSKPEGTGWDNLGKRTVRGVSLHRQQGTNKGTDQFFLNPSTPALTDYGVDHTTGEIYQWADPEGYMSGWASGPYQGPYGDGALFGNKYGANAVNKDRASIELSGYFKQPRDGSLGEDDAISDAALVAMAQLTAHYAHNYGISWEEFPISRTDGFSFVCWHEEFTRGTGKTCPGQRMMNTTAQLIEMVRAIMKKYQTGATNVEQPKIDFAPPLNVDTPEWDGTDRTMPDGTKLWALRRRVTARTTTPRYQRATKTAKRIGPDMKRGDTADVLWMARKGNGAKWYITEFMTRLEASDFEPTITFSDPKPAKPKTEE